MGRRVKLILLLTLSLLATLLSAAAASAQPGNLATAADTRPESVQTDSQPATTDPAAVEMSNEKVEQYWNRVMNEYGGFLPEDRAPTLKEALTSGSGLSVGGVLSGLMKYLFHELLVNGKLLGSIVILTVFSMILETLQSAFEKQTVSKVAYSITFMVLLVLAVNSFNVGIGYAKDAIGNMVDFMMAVVPLLFTLLASMGNVVSVTVMHPFIVFMIHTMSTVIYAVVFPLLFFSTILHIVSSISTRFKVTQLANLLRSISVGILGLFVTLFLGVISVQGTSSAIADGVTLRTAKYVAGTFIPVVGRMFSDASDTVISASLLVKNAVGLTGVITLILFCAFPAIKILSISVIYTIAAAVMQPLGDSPIIKCLQTVGKNMVYVFASLAAVGLMFFLAVTILIAAGNISVMMR
nr:stage III sporulation protein AE [Gorillibacterium massiliense]